MACHHPKPAYLSTEGKVTFVRREKALGNSAFIHIRCGMCRGCKADHARDWAIRCYHEAQGHERNCFVTLTYSDDKLPPHGSLDKRDLQLFWKRFREKIAPAKIRYFAAGEYGTKKGRPHYHAVIFGWCPDDRSIILDVSEKGHPQYYSRDIADAWQNKGRAPWTDFDASCARYVAHYTADKLKSYAKDAIDPETGLRPYEIMDRDGVIWNLTPEFQVQSLRPGIGQFWLEKNWREVFPADTVVMDGKEYPPPRYYYEWLRENQPDVFEKVQSRRKEAAESLPYLTGVREMQMANAKSAKLDRLVRPLHKKG